MNIFEPESPNISVNCFTFFTSLASTILFLSPLLVPWIRIHIYKVQSHQRGPPIPVPHSQPTAFVSSPNPNYTSQELSTPTMLGHSPFTECSPHVSASHCPSAHSCSFTVSCPSHQLTTFYSDINFVPVSLLIRKGYIMKSIDR